MQYDARAVARSRLALLHALVVGSAAMLSTPARADYVFTNLALPGSTYSNVFGINDRGQVAISTDLGSYVYSGGVYTKIPDSPDFGTTQASSINNAGTIVGDVYTYDYANNVYIADGKGFILSNGAFTYVTHPGAETTTFRSIGNGGLITGLATYANGNYAGFIYDPATQQFIDVAPGNSYLSVVGGTNTAGQAVGTVYYGNGSPNASFLRQTDGTFITIGDSATRARGINDRGVITGFRYAGVEHGLVGTSAGFQVVDIPISVTGASGPVSTVPEAINNAGQIAGFWYSGADSNLSYGFIASPASLPIGTTSAGAFVFDTAVIPNVPIFIDPAVATGYDYAIGAGDPLFASVTLPIGIGDNFFTIAVGGQSFTVAGGSVFDFTTHGFASGVATFEVTGIEIDAALNPSNPAAFVTELTFVGAGWFTGTQTPLVTIVSAVPEPDARALFGLAAVLLVAMVRRRRLPQRPASVRSRLFVDFRFAPWFASEGAKRPVRLAARLAASPMPRLSAS